MDLSSVADFLLNVIPQLKELPLNERPDKAGNVIGLLFAVFLSFPFLMLYTRQKTSLNRILVGAIQVIPFTVFYFVILKGFFFLGYEEMTEAMSAQVSSILLESFLSAVSVLVLLMMMVPLVGTLLIRLFQNSSNVTEKA